MSRLGCSSGAGKRGWGELWSQLLPIATRLVHGDVHKAEDLVQSVILKTLVGLEQGIVCRKAWCIHVLRNDASHARARAFVSREQSAPVDVYEADGGDPLEALIRLEQGKLTRLALGRLPETYRDVLVMRFLQGKSASQVAEALRVKRDTVRTRQRRGLGRMREALRGAGYAEGVTGEACDAHQRS